MFNSNPVSQPETPSRNTQHATRNTFHILILLISLLAGCSLFGRSTPTPTSTAIPTSAAHRIPEAAETLPSVNDTGAEVATAAPAVALDDTYRNTTAGYAFHHPAGWVIEGKSGEYVSLQNYASQDLPPREVNDPDLYKIEFVWIHPEQAKTVQEMFEQLRDSLDGPPTEILVNELNGMRLRVRGFGDQVSDVVLLDLNGRVLLIQSWQGGRLFDRIVATLRPLESNR